MERIGTTGWSNFVMNHVLPKILLVALILYSGQSICAAERSLEVKASISAEADLLIGPAARADAAFCSVKWQGPNAGYLTTWFAGDERYAVYQDPLEIPCASPYPFAVTKVVWRVTNQTASTLTIFMQPVIYGIAGGSGSCPSPGATIFSGPLYQVDLPALSQANVALSLQDTVCVTGPYFAGVDCPNLIGLGKLGINLDSAQVEPRRACASYNDFQGSWDEVVTEFNFPGNLLLWSEGNTGTLNNCSTGGNCCSGSRGNIDCSSNNVIDIADLVALVDHLFITTPELCCLAEANVVDDATIDIADLTFLVDFLFVNNPPMTLCP